MEHSAAVANVGAVSWPDEDFRRSLAGLTARQRASFAADCAAYLLPLYRQFVQESGWGDVSAVESCITFARHWGRGVQDERSAQDLAADCKRVTPDTEDFEGFSVSRALDAAAAAVYALRSCSADNLSAVEAVAEICWESAFGLEQEADARGLEVVDLTGAEAQRQWGLLTDLAG